MAGDLKPRMCHVRKWADFAGYGFNLHAEKGRVGQFIGKVDEGSPADAAGMKEGDRIVEVNGTNISNENHAQVVSRIKAVPDETKMLVVDSETDNYYKEQKLVIRGDLPEVLVIVCPRTMGGDADTEESSGLGDATPNSVDEEDHPFKPRLCHLKIWPTFAGYGFNLHAEKNKPGQYIGKVDDGSPAAAAGLREGDKIVEVNGQNISTSNHQAVVQEIKANANETKLLVMDAETLAYFDRKNITVSSSSRCVQTITCPDQAVADSNGVASVEVSSPPPITHPYIARHCHVQTWPDWQGFGFNMHSQKGKPGQFIGSVDAGSPADLAGLKEGDRILAVNGTSVKGFEHPQVVQLIKTNTMASKLLVVDEEADKYFVGKGVEVRSEDDFVVFLENPASKPLANGNSTAVEIKAEEPTLVNGDISAEQSTPEAEVKEEKKEVVEAPEASELREAEEAIDAIAAVAEEAEQELEKEKVEKQEEEEEAVMSYEQAEEEEAPPVYTEVDDNRNITDKTYGEEEFIDERAPTPEPDIEEEQPPTPEPEFEAPTPVFVPEPAPEPVAHVAAPAPAPVAAPAPAAAPAPKSPVVIEGIEFAGSASEARERMSRKKNVKDNALSMKERFEMFQRL